MNRAAPSPPPSGRPPEGDEPGALPGVRAAWGAALRSRGFVAEALATALTCAVVLRGVSVFLAGVERRAGATLDDPLLALFAPRDVAVATFLAIYGGIVLALAVLARTPRRLVRMLHAYLLLIGMRMLLMWATPLDAPERLIPLQDPVVGWLFPGPPLERDLFFSGHTSTLVLLALCVPVRNVRVILLLDAAVCGALLLCQHAHYTVDVLVAPLAAWAAYSMAFVAPAAWRRARGSRT